jgi:hypothetical protein
MDVLAVEWGVGQVFLALLWLFLFIIWIWLVIVVFINVFRSPAMTGWAKALWVLFVIALPFIGVLVYLIVHGDEMQMPTLRFGLPTADDSAGPRSVLTRAQVDALAHLNEQRDQGLISAAEYVSRREDILV